MVRSSILAVLALSAAPAWGAEPPPEARARAALALSQSRSPAHAAVAPAPRPTDPVPYPAGKSKSLETGRPCVVYVGCDAPAKVPGAVTAVAEKLGAYEPGTVLVCYPAEGSLWVDAVLKCGCDPAEVEKAAKVAGKKVEKPTRKLDWS